MTSSKKILEGRREALRKRDLPRKLHCNWPEKIKRGQPRRNQFWGVVGGCQKKSLFGMGKAQLKETPSGEIWTDNRRQYPLTKRLNHKKRNA